MSGNINTLKLADQIKKSLELVLKKQSYNQDSFKESYVNHESFIQNPENKVKIEGLKSSLNDLIANSIKTVCVENDVSGAFTTAQLNAAKFVGAMALNTRASGQYLSNLKEAEGSINAESLGINDTLPFNQINFEAFDGEKTDTNFYYSVIYNFIAAKQNDVAEMFYPTITINPELASIVIELKIASLMNEVNRGLTGAPNKGKFEKIPLAKAIYDVNVFSKDKNFLLPVFRASNKPYLLEEAKRVENYFGEEITTAPLLFGTEFNMLTISQTDTQLSNGTQDQTDALDRAITVTRLYISLDNKGKTKTELFSFDVTNTPYNGFVYNPQGHNKDMILNFNQQSVVFDTRATKLRNGSDSEILTALPEGYVIDVKFTINGEANTQYGDIVLYASNIQLDRIRDKAGNIIAADDPQYDTIAEVFKTVALKAYELSAYRTNSNLRQRGQLITCDIVRQPYTVPVRSGTYTQVPVNNQTGTDNDIDQIVSQADVLGAKMSQDAIANLINLDNFLSDITANGSKKVFSPSEQYGFKSVSSHILYPGYINDSIDLTTVVASLDSSSREDDIRAALLQRIQRHCVKLYINTNYGVAFSSIMGNMNSGKKPTILIATDPYLATLLIGKDLQTMFGLGALFNVKIRVTYDKRLYGKLYIGFGLDDQSIGSEPNPLHHGFCAYAPNVVTSLVRETGKASSQDVIVQPRYVHINNLPILCVMTVTGVEEVFEQIPFPVRNV